MHELESKEVFILMHHFWSYVIIIENTQKLEMSRGCLRVKLLILGDGGWGIGVSEMWIETVDFCMEKSVG